VHTNIHICTQYVHTCGQCIAGLLEDRHTFIQKNNDQLIKYWVNSRPFTGASSTAPNFFNWKAIYKFCF